MEAKSNMICALLLYASMFYGLSKADYNCSVVNTTNPTIEIPEDLPAGSNCTWVISRNSSDVKAMALQLTKVAIDNDATLDIYDGTETETKLMTLSGSSVTSEVLAILSEHATVVYAVKANGTSNRSTGRIAFNREECAADFSNNLALRVTTPIFVSNVSELNCKYVVSNGLPLDRISVVSFADFTLTNESFINLTSGDKMGIFKGGNPIQPDFFVDSTSGGGNVTVQFTLAKAETNQTFALVFDAFVKDCTGDLQLTNASTLISLTPTLPSSPDVSYACRWRVTSKVNPVAILATVTQLALSGHDTLTLTPGSSSLGQAAAELRQAVPPKYLAITSDDAMIMTLTLGSSMAPRSLNVSFNQQNAGGRFVGSGKLEAGSANLETTNTEAGLTTAYYQLIADEAKQVSLNLLTPLTGQSTLTLYRGLQMSDGVLTSINKANVAGLQTLVGGATMLVVLKDFPLSDNFTAVFSSVRQGCDQLATLTIGQLMYTMTPDNDTSDCDWTIAPSVKKGIIVLTFDLLNLGVNDTVKVTAGQSESIASYTGPFLRRPFPQINILSEKTARVSISRSATYRADTRVILNYKVVKQVCGGQLGSKGQLMTPNYPNQYPLNAGCLWKPAVDNETMMYLRFDSLDLAQNHSISVARQEGKNISTLASYGGSASSPDQLPDDLLVPVDNATFVTFTSKSPDAVVGEDINKVGNGAKLEYRVLTCGGNITRLTDSFTSPFFPEPSPDTYCIWMVQLPPTGNDSSLSIEFSINATTDNVDIDKYLFIYDGPSTRYPLTTANVTNGTALSRYRNLTIVLDLEKPGSAQVAFNFSYSPYLCENTTDTQCANGICLHKGWRCNGVDDCGDGSDEKGCPTPPPKPTPIPKQDYSGWVKAAYVPACLFIGVITGAALCFIIPRAVKRIRGGNNYSRMDDDRAAIA